MKPSALDTLALRHPAMREETPPGTDTDPGCTGG